MGDFESTVYVVDDDDSVRQAVARLIRSVGLEVMTFSSASEFLAGDHPDQPSCIVLDIRMPGLSGLDLQDELDKANLRSMPVIFITGHGSIPMSVRAMKAGAVDFLTKPFDDQDLLDAIRKALDKDVLTRRKQAERAVIAQRVARLTPRERQVFDFVVTGMLNKQVSARLGVSEKTVKVHRARVMQKMEVDSFAELVRLSESLKPEPRP